MNAPAPRRIVILNPNATQRMTDEMVAAAQAIAGAQAEVTGLTNTDGPAAIQGPQDAADCLPGLFALFDRAVAQGAQAVIIGCFDDTGLPDLRARAQVPVVGMGEASCSAATAATPRFCVVTTLAVSVPVIEQNIRDMGLWPRCAGVHASGVPVLEIGTGAASLARVQRAVDAALAPGQSVVLGCGGMTTIAGQIHAPATSPVIDPVAAAVRACLHRQT